MTNNTFRLSCEQLEGRDLPSPVAGIQRTPVIQRPAVTAPVVQRTLAPVVTPAQPPVVVASLPAPTPGTMTAPRPSTGSLSNQFGNNVEKVSLAVGLRVTAVGTGLTIGQYERAAQAVERFGLRADLVSLIGPAVDTLNETGNVVRAGAAVIVNGVVQIGGNATIQGVARLAATVFPQYRVATLFAGGVLSIYYTIETTRPQLKQAMERWANQLGNWLESSLGASLNGGLIPSTRPAPTVVVPRGR